MLYASGSNQLYHYVNNQPVVMADPFGLLFLGPPATPSKCGWALFYMKYYALLRLGETYDNQLLNHYLDSSGRDLLLPIDAFDPWGSARRNLADQVVNKLSGVCGTIPCTSSACGFGTLEPQLFKNWMTLMIHWYTMKTSYQWNASKTCDDCGKCKSCKGKVYISFEAYDRTDFNQNDAFGIGISEWLGIYISDQLIRDCQMGKPFDVRSFANTTRSFGGCPK